jgi:hypothetical protein
MGTTQLNPVKNHALSIAWLHEKKEVPLKKHETEGFMMLVEAGLGDQTGEYVVVQNADRFPPEAVSAAKKRLIEHGVLDATE